MFPNACLTGWPRLLAVREALAVSGPEPRVSASTRVGMGSNEGVRSLFAVSRGLAAMAALLLSTSLYALPAPKSAPALHSFRMVQQSIPMPDGIHLAATLYMPGEAKAGEKFPALLEYLPYRKDDATAARDYPVHAWFAARGYVSVRVDIRGFGASEGVPTNREYSEQEQLDGEQVIAWLAVHPWSSGMFGMMSPSFLGFNYDQC